MTDQELVQGIIDRNPAALELIVQTHRQPVIRTCYSLVHRLEDAEDLAQDVFIEIMRSAGSFKGKAKLSSWIYRIAVNKSLNHLNRMNRQGFLPFFRTKDRRIPEKDDPEILLPEDSGGDALLEQKELKKILHMAIDRLPVNQRIAFTLHNYEELPYKEIAEVMNISLSAVESLIHRARQNLRKLLDKYYSQ